MKQVIKLKHTHIHTRNDNLIILAETDWTLKTKLYERIESDTDKSNDDDDDDDDEDDAESSNQEEDEIAQESSEAVVETSDKEKESSPLPQLLSPKGGLVMDESLKTNEDDDEIESSSSFSSNYDAQMTPSDNDSFNYTHKKLHFRSNSKVSQHQKTQDAEISNYTKPISVIEENDVEVTTVGKEEKNEDSNHDQQPQQQQQQQQQQKQLEPHQLQFQQQYMILFNCKICGKGFKHRRSLNRHVKLHTGEKHFKCTYCDTAFARSDHLKAHIRTHNNSKPFKCSICQCGYNTQSALKVHIAHHHHTKAKYKCLNCCKEFDSKYNLDEHIFTVHDVTSNKNTAAVEDKVDEVVEEISQRAPSPIIQQENKKPLSPVQQTPPTPPTPPPLPLPPSNKTFFCKYCSQVCLGEASLKKHLNEEHCDTLVCHYCNNFFRTINDYDLHLNNCSNDQKREIIYNRQPSQSPSQIVIMPQQQQSQVYGYNPNKRLRFETPTNFNQNYNKQAPLPLPPPPPPPPPPPLSSPTLKYVQNQNIQNNSPTSTSPQRPLLKQNLPIYVTNYFSNGPVPHQMLSGGVAPQSSAQIHLRQNGHPLQPSTPAHQYQNQNYCELCNANFSNSENFHAHMKSHPNYIYTTQMHHQNAPQINNDGKLPHLTSILTKNDNTPSSIPESSLLEELLREFCVTEGQFLCNACNLTFTKSTDHLDHMKFKHCIEVYRCILCKDVQLFDNQQLLKQHFIHIHGSKQSDTFRCKLCNSIYRQINEFIQHLKHAHRIDANLMMPPQLSPTQKPPHNILMSPTQKPPIMVPTQKSLLHQQLIKQAPQLQPSYMSILGPSQTQPVLMNTIKQQQIGMASYKCSTCNIFFEKEADFRQHIQQEHENMPNQDLSFFKCLYCPSTYLNQIHLDKHMETVHIINNSQETTPLKPRYQILNKQLSQFPQQPIFKCQICDLKFPREDLLNLHKINDHNMQSYVSQQQHALKTNNFCKFCQNNFSNKQQLEKHMKIHLSSIDMRCNICDKNFDNINLLNEHKLVHAKSYESDTAIPQPSSSSSPSASSSSSPAQTSSSSVCAFCKQVVNDEAQFREHCYKHSNEQSCIICKQQINSEADLTNHSNFHFKPKANQQQNFEMYNCYFCSRIMKQSVDEIEYKYDPVTNRLRRLCKLCSTKYANDKQKQQQQQQQQQQENNFLDSSNKAPITMLKIVKNKLEYLNDYYYCIFEANEADDELPIQNNNNYELRCPKCSVKFESWQALTSHYETHRKPSGTRTYTCIKCQNQYLTEIEIREHIQEHKKSEICGQCKNIFNTPAQLENHLLSKHEFPNGIFTCPICHEAFAKADNLFSHTITHGAEGRFYKCHHCVQSFAFKTQFLNHLYVHKANVKINNNETASNQEQQELVIDIKKENTITNEEEIKNDDNPRETPTSSSPSINDNYLNVRNSTPKKRKPEEECNNTEDEYEEQLRCSSSNDEFLMNQSKSITVEPLNNSDIQKFQIYNGHENSNSSASLNNSSKKLNLYNNHKEQLLAERNEFKCVLCDHVSLFFFFLELINILKFINNRLLSRNQFYKSILLKFMQMNQKQILMI